MVLGLLQQALVPMAEVSTASDSADALLKAVEEVPDLLISDYRMPGMDGRQLLEKLKSRPGTAAIAVLLMASKGDISERLSLQEGIEDLIEKPFFLKDAVRRIKRVVDRIALEKLANDGLGEALLDAVTSGVVFKCGDSDGLPFRRKVGGASGDVVSAG